MGSGQGVFLPATAAPATTLLRADPSTPRSVSTDETVPGGTAPELVRKPWPHSFTVTPTVSS